MIPEQNHEKIRKTGHRWIEISAAGCALVVSITSLFVAIRRGQSLERVAESQRTAGEANSWPLPQRYQSDADEHGARVFSLQTLEMSGVIGTVLRESVSPG